MTAIISTQLMAHYFEVDLTESSYYKENINYFAIALGGTLFGVGMIIADGCSSRHLIKFAQGDSKSVIALLFIGIFAYATTKGLLFGLFDPLINNETLIALSGKIGNITMNVFVVIILLALLLKILVMRPKRIIELWDGVLIGLLVSVAWYITGVYGQEAMERVINLSGIAFVYPTAKSLELFHVLSSQ